MVFRYIIALVVFGVAACGEEERESSYSYDRGVEHDHNSHTHPKVDESGQVHDHFSKGEDSPKTPGQALLPACNPMDGCFHLNADEVVTSLLKLRETSGTMPRIVKAEAAKQCPAEAMTADAFPYLSFAYCNNDASTLTAHLGLKPASGAELRPYLQVYEGIGYPDDMRSCLAVAGPSDTDATSGVATSLVLESAACFTMVITVEEFDLSGEVGIGGIELTLEATR